MGGAFTQFCNFITDRNQNIALARDTKIEFMQMCIYLKSRPATYENYENYSDY